MCFFLLSLNKSPFLKEGPQKEKGIADRIFTIRGAQVLLDSDIAALFQVDVKRLNEQMKRNSIVFPRIIIFS